ncbi:MAG: MBL fold metallo-hydrolase [Tepidisphaeraceae bacterium]|jgi:phosphoribosyl 1,2-cyclic phosphodiesterase
MSLSLCILASGSAGNCSVLRGPRGAMLIDCGIAPRTAAGRMKGLGIGVGDVAAICLTHLDGDHFNPAWAGRIVQQGIAIFCHEDRTDELSRLGGGAAEFARLIRPFNGRPFSPVEGVQFTAIRLDHDEHGSHGFRVEGFGSRIGYATDLGRPSSELVRQFRGVGVLAIESNYDPQMQASSDRPLFLKRRIMGGRGHLSNQEALDTVRRILDQADRRGAALPRHIVLLHRSRQCNCPRLLRDLFGADGRIGKRLVLAEQDRPTGWLWARSEPACVQLELHWA